MTATEQSRGFSARWWSLLTRVNPAPPANPEVGTYLHPGGCAARLARVLRAGSVRGSSEMKYGIAVGLCMAALGACQVMTLPRGNEARTEVSTSELFDRGSLTVMTRGLSTGLELERMLEAPTAADVPVRTAAAFNALRHEDLSARARKLADEIQYARPHLIGLQRVERIQLQSPGDAIFGGTRPADTVYLDVLPVLLGELEARGLHYREVARVRNSDVELPMHSRTGDGYDDVRLTDYGVILAREDVQVTEARTGNYRLHREVSRPGWAPVALSRGWASVKATVEGRPYRFVSTHLEPAPDDEGPNVQLAQAEELIASLRNEPLPVVLVGNFNTPANLGLLGAPTYRELLLAGYVDVWTRRANLALEVPSLTERPNLVLVRHPVAALPGRLGPVLAYGVGGPLGARGFGPWPADVMGVVARLRMPVAVSTGYTGGP